jgi:hypothetical protein
MLQLGQRYEARITRDAKKASNKDQIEATVHPKFV